MRNLIGGEEDIDLADWEPLRAGSEQSGSDRQVKMDRFAAANMRASTLLQGGVAKAATIPALKHPVDASLPADSALPEAREKMCAPAPRGTTTSREAPACGEEGLEVKPQTISRHGCPASPSLAELHDQALAIRQNNTVWDPLELGLDFGRLKPNPATILDHYRTAIEAMDQMGANSPDDRSKGEPGRELPRFADAAPLSPFFKSEANASNNRDADPLLKGEEHDQVFAHSD